MQLSCMVSCRVQIALIAKGSGKLDLAQKRIERLLELSSQVVRRQPLSENVSGAARDFGCTEEAATTWVSLLTPSRYPSTHWPCFRLRPTSEYQHSRHLWTLGRISRGIPTACQRSGERYRHASKNFLTIGPRTSRRSTCGTCPQSLIISILELAMRVANSCA